MAQRTKFVVGGETIEVSPLSIWALRQPGVWEAITSLDKGRVIDRIDKFLTIVAAGVVARMDDPTPDLCSKEQERLSRMATIDDLVGLDQSTLALFRESGLAPREDDPPVEGEAPATGSSSDATGSGTT